MAMTQEDGFIEVKTNLYNRTPLLKWVRPVVVKKLRLLFDVYCLFIVSRESDLDFSDMENMNTEEYLTWMIYGGTMSYGSTKNYRPKVSVLDAERWMKGVLQDDRIRILRTIEMSKEIGELTESYMKARNPEGEAGRSKKVEGSVQQN